MKDSLVILMDCWQYLPNDPCLIANLRKPMCENINEFVENNHEQIHTVIDANYAFRNHHPDLDIFNWKVLVEKILYTKELIDFVKVNNIKRIWYTGLHWNRCIRHREIGYNSLLEQLTLQGLEVKLYCIESCTLENITEKEIVLFERVPDFANDPVTDLVQVNDRDWQILGTRKDWNGKI